MAQPIPLPPPVPPRAADPAPMAQGASMVVLFGPADRPRDPRPLGQILVEDGAVDQGDLLKATIIRQRQDLPLARVLLAQGMVTPEAMARALARQWRTTPIDPALSPADPRLIAAAGPGFCLTHGILPWRRIGGVTWIATARPDDFAGLLARLPRRFGQVHMLLCTEAQVEAGVLASSRIRLIRAAETCVPAAESCRSQDQGRIARLAALALTLTVAAAVLVPGALVAALTAWAVVTLLAQSGLKLACVLAAGRTPPPLPPPAPCAEEAPLPVISVMVPLFHEKDVAGRLVARLARLTYPRDRTDIVLVIEASDHVTEDALKDARLPHWMRVVRVPDGPVKTKPRALNYALNFCRGQIVGIWDAEDRPEPDQLHKVARRFHEAPADVACLQGALDYYNPRTNWLARCFTVEYAAWFRILLPGVARLGLIVPLGGTTLFFRRPLLERVGAWDAWNVTEDADLGVRLARRGLRTEILDTTTDEEANCRALPWIRQRSRWLKGYAMTWAVHMRDPVALHRDLGARRFWGFQIQFLATLSQYLLAPILWSFWLLTLGLPHPLREPLHSAVGAWAIAGLFALFVASEALSIFVGMRAVRGPKHRHLMPWVPTLHLYYPIGCLAGWKAIYEVVARPFYWDKTAHGLYAEAPDAPAGATGRIAVRGAAPGLTSIPLLGRIGGRSLAELAAGMPGMAPPAIDPPAIAPIPRTALPAAPPGGASGAMTAATSGPTNRAATA